MKLKIVAPGGSYQKAIVAANYGADEIYVGVPFTSLRMRQNKVKSFDELRSIVKDLHFLDKKALLTMNIFPRNNDIKIFESIVEEISDVKADAIIFSDLGTYSIIRKHFPNVPLHLSTQTSTMNYEAVKFRRDLGVKRIVCARELHISEIREIKKEIPDVELEVFVHGAMCMSYSGRCLLGDYMSGRSGNKGECSHACRFKYKVWLEESKRPGKLFQLGEDDDGSYILSSKDLCVIDKLDEIIDCVDAIKIEGRSKSEFYVASVVSAYKNVRDALLEGKSIDQNIKNLVYKIPHREYRDGFLFNKIADYPDGENIEGKNASIDAGITQNSPGPLFNRNYFGIFLPETINIDGNIYTAFIPKENIERGQTYKYLSPGFVGEVDVIDILSDSQKGINIANCNMKKVYLYTSKTIDPWGIFFS